MSSHHKTGRARTEGAAEWRILIATVVTIVGAIALPGVVRELSAGTQLASGVWLVVGALIIGVALTLILIGVRPKTKDDVDVANFSLDLVKTIGGAAAAVAIWFAIELPRSVDEHAAHELETFTRVEPEFSLLTNEICPPLEEARRFDVVFNLSIENAGFRALHVRSVETVLEVYEERPTSNDPGSFYELLAPPSGGWLGARTSLDSGVGGLRVGSEGEIGSLRTGSDAGPDAVQLVPPAEEACPDGLSNGIAPEPYRHDETFSESRRWLVTIDRDGLWFVEARSEVHWCAELPSGGCVCSSNEDGAPRPWVVRDVERLFAVAFQSAVFCDADGGPPATRPDGGT